jgi:superoxide dismutase, Cu-Zn family
MTVAISGLPTLTLDFHLVGPHARTICTHIHIHTHPHTGKTHGASSDAERMVGDLGNILADENGHCTVTIADKQVQLLGPHSVIGRSLVIYAGEDDKGRGGHENSLSTGNPGPRMAAGVIGLSA